jgi:Tfp pilus assembly protein PilN
MKTQNSRTLHLRITPQEIVILSEDKTDASQQRTHQLATTDIINHRVINLTALARHIDNLVKELKFTNPHLVVEAPFLEENDHYALLSLALCLSKSGCAINSIYSAINGRNLLDAFLPSGYHQIYRWLALCGACLCVAWLGLSSQSIKFSQTLKTNNHIIKSLNDSNNDLKKRVALVHDLEKENAILKKKASALTALNHHTFYPKELCSNIARTIPATTKLLTLDTGQKPGAISLTGITTQPHEINAWVKKLSGQQNNFKFSLASLIKQKRIKVPGKKSPAVYAFMIQGCS